MKKIKGFENYVIYHNTDVMNTNTGRVLVQSKNPKGYKMLVLSKDGITKTKLIHRLMYEAFIGDIPEGMQINHIDGDKTNNNINNLEAITQHENILHAVRTGIIKSGSDSILSKAVLKIDCITGLLLKKYGSAREASKDTGVANSAISSVCNGKRITAGGYKWEFENK